MSKIGLIIKREFIAKVRNKSFIVMTFLSPLLFVGIGVFVGYLSTMKAEQKTIAIHDETGKFFSQFKTDEEYKYINLSDVNVKTLKDSILSEAYEGLLVIPKYTDKLSFEKGIQYVSNDSPSVSFVNNLEDIINQTQTKENLIKSNLDTLAISKANSNVEIKLEMRGEPVTISNIEKKVSETYENVSNKFRNVDTNQVAQSVKSGTDRVGNALMAIFGAFAKVLGALIVVFSSLSLIGLLIGLFTFGSTSFIETPWQRYINAVNYTDIPLWAFGLFSFLAIGIPLFFFLILGLKLLVTNMKPISNIIKYSLLAIWIFTVGALVFIGIKQSTEMAFNGRIMQKEVLTIQPNDTLFIKFNKNDYFKRESYGHENFIFTQDSLKNEVIYSNNIDFEIKNSNSSQAYIEIEKKAEGKSFREANERAEKIKYSFKLTNNQLILDNYLLTEMASKFRNQRVNISLYLPVGTLFKVDESVEDYDRSDDDYFNLHFSDDKYLYKVEREQVKCLDCPDEENEYNDVDTDSDIETEDINVTNENDTVKTISVKVNGKEIITKKEGKTDGASLKIDENGIIIKTK